MPIPSLELLVATLSSHAYCYNNGLFNLEEAYGGLESLYDRFCHDPYSLPPELNQKLHRAWTADHFLIMEMQLKKHAIRVVSYHDDAYPESLQTIKDKPFQLYVQDEELGSLNLYSRTASGFDDVDEITGLLFASHAAVVLAGAQHESNLQAALAGLDIIGQAKGILMERYQLTEAAAFAVLVQTSQCSNRKLRDIAETLALTGILEMTTHTQSGDL